ncbi:hypothetical protein SETIT_2G144100v2 [Setaria italica]|uniref:Uncharacterized protein n=2 Tax=Setaria italica TaxID=4555 RepID=A0A368PZ26_SETIT|nr:hypothetical protein SETIT_2G144100v2 [Setaria italica]
MEMGFRWRCWWPGQANGRGKLGRHFCNHFHHHHQQQQHRQFPSCRRSNRNRNSAEPSLQMLPLLLLGSSCLIRLPGGGVLGTGRKRGILGCLVVGGNGGGGQAKGRKGQGGRGREMTDECVQVQAGRDCCSSAATRTWHLLGC